MTDTHKTTLVRAEPVAMEAQRMHPLVQAAMAGGGGLADPATLRELLAVQREWEAGEARKVYVAAMARLKTVLPTVIARDSKVSYGEGKSATYYTHASLGGVMDAVTGPLTDHGFSLAWSTSSDDRAVRVTCRLTHIGGHIEETTLSAPPDAKGGKNGAQAIMSTITMLERYTALALLGIATRDMREPTGEAEKVAAAGDGVDAERNLLAVSALQKAGIDVAEVEAKLGRKAPAWTAADRERVRDLLPRKGAKPRENQDGSLDVDPPKG